MNQSGIAGIDHIIVGVRDLEAARANWTRLGFTQTPRGRHIGQGTANYCIMFGRDYLELLGFVERDEHAHRLESFLARREGAMSVAFAPERDAAAASAALAGLGLHPTEPRALGRALELPEGNVTLRFSLVTLPPEETPGLDCFICGHLTPELVRRPDWLKHANGVTGIEAVHLWTDDATPLASAYEKLFGKARVKAESIGVTVDTGRNRLFLVQRPNDHAEPLGISFLGLQVEDLAATAAYFKGARIRFDRFPDGTLAVPASEANGIAMLFGAARTGG